MAAYRNRSFNLTGNGEPLRIEGELVAANFFTTLQIEPELGRGFTSDEDRASASHVAVVSDSLSPTSFGSDAQILGNKILLDSELYEVIVVMPPGFHFPVLAGR